MVYVIFGMLAAPLLALLSTALRALVMFWPTMLVLGALNTYIEWVPALGWFETFLVVMLFGLLVPTSDGVNSNGS